MFCTYPLSTLKKADTEGGIFLIKKYLKKYITIKNSHVTLLNKILNIKYFSQKPCRIFVYL